MTPLMSNNVTQFMIRFVTVLSLAMEEMVGLLEVFCGNPQGMLELFSLDMVQLQPHLAIRQQCSNAPRQVQRQDC